MFNASVDVQTKGTAAFLKYVTGYVPKASDALTFKQKVYRQSGTSQWRQAYRLLTKRAPLQPEMAVDFAGLPLTEASFRGATVHAPVPKPEGSRPSAAKNTDRALYEAYLRHQNSIAGYLQAGKRQSFIEWARENTVIKKTESGEDKVVFEAKKRGGHGVGKNKEKCALGVRFPFEQLDIFIGAWCATMVPHVSENEFAPQEDDPTPEFARYLKKALEHPHYRGDVNKLKKEINADLQLRGLKDDRRFTFLNRIDALKLLLDNTGDKGMCIPAEVWSRERLARNPARVWSDEQREVLEIAASGVAVDDANVDAHSRLLFVSGKPGAGKTEAVIGCALAAAEKGERVLIACPIGALVDTYRQRLPPNENIVIETIHASHHITRKADEHYIPPGRLRTFDLIIDEEVSQLEGEVWQKVRTAITELNPHPFVMLVGDFQQLQAAYGEPILKQTLEPMIAAGTLRHVELQQHPLARSTDSELLDFLERVREHQPEKTDLIAFFGDRRLARGANCRDDRDVANAVAESVRLERETGKNFTFLTVTNKAAKKINHTRCAQEFAHHDRVINADRHKVAGDPELAGEAVAIPGMKVRLTRNVDKERGFVNGALAVIEWILADDVFIVKTQAGVRILVHPVTLDKQSFVPFCYGYAMTIRRAQGSTLQLVGLWFDHSYPADRGYAYVGSSRVRHAKDLYLMGKVKRTDWLPVGGGDEGEQLRRDDDSKSSCRDSDEPTDDEVSSDEADSDEDQGATTTEDESEDQGAASEDEEVEADEDHGATSSDNDIASDADESEPDYDRLADAEPETKPEVAPPRRPAPAAGPVYTAAAMEVTRSWCRREGIAGPYRQLQLGSGQ